MNPETGMKTRNDDARKLLWTRRRLLEGFGLSALTIALPALEAFGGGGTKKLVLFHFGNGAPQDGWKELALQREGLGDMLGSCTLTRGLP